MQKYPSSDSEKRSSKAGEESSFAKPWLRVTVIVLAVVSALFLLLAAGFFLLSRQGRKNAEKIAFNPIEQASNTEREILETLKIMPTEAEPELAEQQAGRSERRIIKDPAAVMAEMSELLEKGKSLALADEVLENYSLGQMADAESDLQPFIRQQVQAIQAAIPDDLGIQVQEDTVTATYELPLTAAFEMGNFVETGVQLWVFAEIANIRQDASIDAPKLGEAVRGDFVWEVSSNGAWSYVVFQDGTAGYIYKDLLREVEVEHEVVEVITLSDEELDNLTPFEATLYSKNSGVRIRKTPSTESEIIGELYYGDSVQCIAYGIDWYQVILPDGQIGYIYGDLVQFDPVEDLNPLEEAGENFHDYDEFVDENDWYEPEIPVAEPSAGGQGLVNLALQHVGKPYVLGATGPDAFDCSGFVQFLLAQMGVSVGRTTYDQVHAGSPVNWGGDVNNLLPGDIILLGRAGDIYHSMIYIGNGQIVHAGTPATGVNVDQLEWYMSQIAHVRRIFY
ncbi:MAG: SH3 domain-containing C40 family peptidase [Eubacteriales bacterium]|nr:SH3 domain-containing C40 family peptidase [Eubacteriales bacterium]